MNLSEVLFREQNMNDCGCISGIMTGIVKENWDEENPGMVKVEMFLGREGENVTGLARVMTNYAGDGYGNYWFPETGQKVIIAFLLGERDCPVILGTLWDKKNMLPENKANEDNTVKSFTTKGGCSLIFNDEKDKENIEITTPGKLSISLKDEDKSICLRDENGENMAEVDCKNGSISLMAKTKIELKIGDNAVISIEENSLKLKSKEIIQSSDTKVSVEGQNIGIQAKTNVDISANAQAAFKASAGMRVSSDAMLELKGAMVKLN